jgi:hypothetical protein
MACDMIAQPRARTRGSHKSSHARKERTPLQNDRTIGSPHSPSSVAFSLRFRRSFWIPISSWTMIDHILGRPSQRLKSLQVLLVLIAWTGYLIRGNRHGPYFVRRISRRTSTKLTPWQTFCVTLTGLYLLKNLDKLLGLGGSYLVIHSILIISP